MTDKEDEIIELLARIDKREAEEEAEKNRIAQRSQKYDEDTGCCAAILVVAALIYYFFFK